jgi:hypothetical protein
MEDDGSFYARGREVHRNPEKTARGYTLGFPVCVLSEYVHDEMAERIAEALNALLPPKEMEG